MKKFLNYMSVSMLLSLSTVTAHGQLIINELMQSNIDCIMDDLNDFPDSWVELYNKGDKDVNLGDYSIGDNKDAATAWKLPAQTVKAGGYVIVYCDKVGEGLHTDFRLESGKDGKVYLFLNGKEAEKLTKMSKQPAPNIAYGRREDGSSEWGYMLTPTPGAANAGGITSDILGAPVFNEPGRVFEGNSRKVLQLSVPEGSPEGTIIRYTTDGSEPTASSQQYTKSITITKTTVIRAKLFCDGWLSPRSTVQSYIFHGRKQTLPVISITTDDKYLNDKTIGIYTDATWKDGKKNFEHDWRRPMHIEMYEENNTTCALNQLVEARIQGGQSRNWQLKSMTVYANKRFGEKRLAYEFFPDQRPGQTNFKSIILRNAGNDFDYLYMRDAVIQRNMSSHCDIDWQAWRPAIVYINGVYRGMLNIRERSNDDNIFTNYEELEDIDMVENWSDLKTGTWDNYNAFKEFYTQTGHTKAEYDKWMDTSEFMDIMITNLFYCNLDFPGNNIVMWRPTAEGGKWRWILKDTDFGLGLYGRDVNYNTIKWIYNPNYDSSNAWANTADATRLFRRLMDDKDFNREFIDRCAIYMGDFMNDIGTRKVWDPMYAMIRTEYPFHRELFNRWWPNYDEELTNARNWITSRPAVFYQHLAEYYKLGTPVPLAIMANNIGDARVVVNNIPLAYTHFEGKFFQDRELTLSSISGNETKVTGWTIEKMVGRKTTTETIMQPTYTFTMPQATRLVITPITEDASGINEVSVGNASAQCKKIIRDGRVIIIRSGKEYNVNGIEINQGAVLP